MFLLLQFSVVIGRGNVQVVFGFGFRGLEWAGKNTNLSIMDFFGHLGVRHVLVDQNTVNQLGIVHGSSSFSIDFDELEVNILSL